jgi:hypothetical protein
VRVCGGQLHYARPVVGGVPGFNPQMALDAVPLPEDVVIRIRDFDLGLGMEPFSFEVDVP